MKPTRTLLWSLFVATLALGCRKEEDTGDSDTDSGDTDTADTDTDSDTGTEGFTCPTDDPNEPDDSASEATPLSAGTDILGQICEGDTDFFVLNVPDGCIVDALLDFDEQETDFDLYLYDSTETVLAWSESSSTDEDILFKNNGAATTWYLEAVGYLDAEGGYSIGFDCATTTCTDDDNEPNDSLAEATALPTAGTNEAGQTCLADLDWYSIPVGPGCDLDVHLDFTQTTGDLDLWLYDADENLLDYSVSEDDDEDVSYDNPSGATTVYAKVEPYARAEAPYTISYTVDCPPPCTDDLFEPSDDLASAKELTSGDAPTAAQVCLFDEDWYKFTTHVGCDLDVTMTLTNADGDLDLFLLDDQEAELDTSETTADIEKVRFNNRPAGSVEETLYAVVRPVGEAQNGYNVALLEDCAPCDDVDDGIAENDDAAHAVDLNEDTAFEGSICTGDADWFTVHDETGPGCKITATLSFVGDDGDLDLSLVDSNGDTVGNGPATTADLETISYRLVADDPADVFLKVYSEAGDEGPYELQYNVDCTPCTDDGEPNDADTDAHPIDADTEFSGRQCFDDDWYTIAATSGCEGVVTLSSPDPEADLDLHIYDGVGGALIAESEQEYADEQVSFDNSNGDYTDVLVLVDYFGGDEPLYTLEWTEDCTASCTDAGTDSTLGTATALAEDTPTEGVICQNDEDWYALTAGVGCAVDVLVEYEYEWGDVDAYLYDPSQVQLDHSYSTDDNETIFHVNDTAGTSLFLQVIGYTPDTPPNLPRADNSYTVSYDTVCQCPEDGVASDHDTRAEALPITPNGAPYHGGICTVGAEDWFSFTGSAGCDVAAVLSFLGFTEALDFRSDLDLYLVDSTGEVLDGSILGLNQEDVSHTVGGTNEALFLQVIGYDLSDDGAPGPTGDLGVDYDLSVTQVCP